MSAAMLATAQRTIHPGSALRIQFHIASVTTQSPQRSGGWKRRRRARARIRRDEHGGR